MKRSFLLGILCTLCFSVFAQTTFLVPKNNATGDLKNDITDVATSIVFETGQGSNFPSTFPYHVVIDNEIVKVTNRVVDTLTVTRAQEGTSAVAHYASDDVLLNITAEYLSEIQDTVNALEIKTELPVIDSVESVTVNLDTDANGSNESFKVMNGAGYEVFRAYENGVVDIIKNDAGTMGESQLRQFGAGETFRWVTLSTNLRLSDSSGEIVRFNFNGTRLGKDLMPLYTWDVVEGPANLGASTNIWKELYVKNVYQYGSTINQIQTFTESATPTVLNGKVFLPPATLTGNVSVTSFANVVSGQEVIIVSRTIATYTWTLANTGVFQYINGTWAGNVAGNTIHLIYDGTNWQELSRR
jgi:hypothetical protein